MRLGDPLRKKQSVSADQISTPSLRVPADKAPARAELQKAPCPAVAGRRSMPSKSKIQDSKRDHRLDSMKRRREKGWLFVRGSPVGGKDNALDSLSKTLVFRFWRCALQNKIYCNKKYLNINISCLMVCQGLSRRVNVDRFSG